MVFRILRSILMLFVQVFIWKGLYSGHDTMAGVTLKQMITYVVLSRFIGIASSAGGSDDIEAKMKTGDICIDFLRPASPRMLFVFQNLGSTLASLLLDGLPVLAAGIIFLGGIQPPVTVCALAYFIAALLGALMVNISLEILLGTFSFWFLDASLVKWFIGFFDTVLSGAAVPLWFFPDWLRHIAEALPFQAVRFVPAAIYLGQLSGGDAVKALATQTVWVVILLLLQDFLWRKGIKRIVVLGG